MKYTTLTILAAFLPAQMAFAADNAINPMDALESLNGKGYVDLGIEETNDRIIVFGEKMGKRIALTYDKDGFDFIGKRITSLNPEKTTPIFGKNILTALEATDDDEPVAAATATMSAAAASAAVVQRLHEVEEDTDEARQELKDLKEVGASDDRLDHAEHDLHEKEEEEDDIRAIAKAEDAATKTATTRSAIEQRLHEVEEETDEARQELKDLKEIGASESRIAHAEQDLHEKEEEEDDIRAIAKGE